MGIEGFEIEFAGDTPPDAVAAIVADVRARTTDVADAGTRVSKGAVTDTILAWVQVAGPTVGVLTAVVNLVTTVVDRIRGAGVTGAKITLPDGTVIEVDSASVEGVERLVRAAAESG